MYVYTYIYIYDYLFDTYGPCPADVSWFPLSKMPSSLLFVHMICTYDFICPYQGVHILRALLL